MCVADVFVCVRASERENEEEDSGGAEWMNPLAYPLHPAEIWYVNNPIYVIVIIVEVSFCYFIVQYLLAFRSDNLISVFVLHAFILKVFR